MLKDAKSVLAAARAAAANVRAACGVAAAVVDAKRAELRDAQNALEDCGCNKTAARKS